MRDPPIRGFPTLLVFLALACVGCVSFSESRLPKRALADIENWGKLSPITFQFPERDEIYNYEFDEKWYIEPLLRRAFAEAVCGNEQGEWHLDICYRTTERNVEVSVTTGLLFLLSLGIFPSYRETDLSLETKLLHHGRLVKEYVYEENLAEWGGWLLLPWFFNYHDNDPWETEKAFIGNMTLNLIYDVAAEMQRAGSSPGG